MKKKIIPFFLTVLVLSTVSVADLGLSIKINDGADMISTIGLNVEAKF